MEDTLNSSSDKEKGGGGLCEESSSASTNNGIRISVSSRGGVNYQQGDGDENQDERCQRSEPQINACARIKHKTTVRKQYKNRMKRRLNKCNAQSAKGQKSVSEICFGSVAMPQEPAQHVTNLGNSDSQPAPPVFVSQPVPSTGGKEHVIDEDETDTEDHYARGSRSSNRVANAEVTLSDLWNDFPLRDNSPPSHDIDREVPDYVQSGTQNNSSYLTPSNRAEYFFAPFLNNQITLGPEERNFCAQNEDDIKLLQILRFIQSCDGALGLLWNFIREHVELFSRQEANVAREENEEGREPEEDYVADVEVYDEETDIDIAHSDEGQFSEYDNEEEAIQTDYQEQTQVEYQIFDEDGDISEASIEVTEEDSECDYTDISEEEEYDLESQEVNSAEEGDEEATAHTDTESDSDTGTYNDGEVYPYEEIEDDLNEEEDGNGTREDGNDGAVSRTNDGFRGEFNSVSFGDLSELISSFTLSSISTSESEDDVGDTPLLWERNSVKMVSVGIQTGSSENCEGYSSVAQTFRNKSVHKQRTPYSIPIMPLARKRGGRLKGHPYKGAAHRYRLRAKEEKVLNLCPEEECDGQKSYTNGDSDTSLENDTHCRGDSCHIIKRFDDVKQCQDKLEEDFKGGDMGGLQETSGLCENERIVVSRTGTETENKYVDAEAKGFNVEEKDTIPVVDISCQTVSGSPLTPETDLNDEETDLATGDTQIRLTANVGAGKNILDSTLQNGEMNKPEGEKTQGTGKQGCPVWKILRHLECPFKWVPDIFIRRIPNSRIQENIIAHLTEKEKEFARAKCNIFREVVIHLVLVYEKTLEDRLMEAIADLQHCYTLLGNPQIIMSSTNTNTEELDLNLVRGNYYFNELKCKRMNLFYSADENLTEDDDAPSDEDRQILKISNPPKHIARGQVGSPNSELMVKCTRVETVEQADQVENITDAKDYQKDGLSEYKKDKEIARQCTLTVINNEDRDGKVEFHVSEVTECPDAEFQSDQPLHKDEVMGSGFEDMRRKMSVGVQNKKLSQFKEIESKMNGRNFDNEKDENVNVCGTENDSERQRQVQSIGVHVAPEDFTHTVQEIKNVNPNYVKDCCVAVSGTGDATVGSFEVDVKGIGCNGRVMDCRYCSTSCEEDKSNPKQINAERNEETLCNHKLQDDVINRTMKDSGEEKSAGEDGEADRQMQRRAALEYVVNATLAHVAYFSESNQEAYKLAKFTEHTYKQLGHAGKATVAAIRGAMLLEYGFAGNQLGLQFLQKALKLDPEYWEWNLYCGKVMSRVRRVEKCKGGEPGKEEVSLLEKAVELNQEDASALVHLANAYRALAHFIYRQKMEAEVKAGSVMDTRHYVRFGGTANWRANWSQSRCSQQQEEVTPFQKWRNPQHIPLPRHLLPLDADEKDYLQLAKELFLKALKMEPHCPYNNARCAKGLWAMPFPYKDKERAKEAILHALTLAPDDSLVNHFAGSFYEFCHDYEKALDCYERATLDSKFNYPAEMNYINLKMKINPQGSYSPVFRLDKLVSKYRNPNYMQQIFCHRGFYLYKVEKQYFQAIRNIATAIKIDPGSQTLKTFYPGNFYGRNLSYNMYDLLETMAAEYEKLPEGLENKDFVEETLGPIRRLREENCKQNDKYD